MEARLPSAEEFKKLKRVAEARCAIAEMMQRSDERDVVIWMSAFIEQLKRLSDLSLMDEQG